MKFSAIIFSALIASAAAVATQKPAPKPAPVVYKPAPVVYKPAPVVPKCTHGDIICSADKKGFDTCVNGQWVNRACGPYTECFSIVLYKGKTPKDDKTLVYCGYPVAPIAPKY
jgi:hypothetical protein